MSIPLFSNVYTLFTPLRDLTASLCLKGHPEAKPTPAIVWKAHQNINATHGNESIGINTARISWTEVRVKLFFRSKLGALVHQQNGERVLLANRMGSLWEGLWCMKYHVDPHILNPQPHCFSWLLHPDSYTHFWTLLRLWKPIMISCCSSYGSLFFLVGKRGGCLDKKLGEACLELEFGGHFQVCLCTSSLNRGDVCMVQPDQTLGMARISVSKLDT